jgi:hypothetical protein
MTLVTKMVHVLLFELGDEGLELVFNFGCHFEGVQKLLERKGFSHFSDKL